MRIADKYAQKNGYKDATSMNAKIKETAIKSNTTGDAMVWYVQSAILDALNVIDATNQIEVEASDA